MKRNAILISFLLICIFSMSAHGQESPPKAIVAETDADIEKERTPLVEKLYELVRSADRIVVNGDPKEGSKVFFQSSNPKDLAEFRDALSVIVPEYWTLSICAEPHITLYRSGKEIVTIGNVFGNAVRTSVWSGNVTIADSEKWLKWFDSRGMPQVRKEHTDTEFANKKYSEEEARWYSAMPKGLKDSYEEQRDRRGIPGVYELGPMNTLLVKEYPEKDERIRSLLHWYGSGSEGWSSRYDYEVIAEKLLFQYKTVEIVKALDLQNSTETQIEGAARLFVGWDFYKTRPKDFNLIPKELRKRLLNHAHRSRDEAKIKQMMEIFAVK
ncbi:MAG: hypothetical protein WKF92_03110 [Pyrinomonadaceae bacterium]